MYSSTFDKRLESWASVVRGEWMRMKCPTIAFRLGRKGRKGRQEDVIGREAGEG